MPNTNGSSDQQLDAKLKAIDDWVQMRRKQVEEALATHLPDFPIQLLRETFGAKLVSLRSPTVNFGPEPERGLVAGPLWYVPWVIPKPPKGDYPVVVVEMSPEKRRFLRRLRRVRRASKIRHHEHEYE